MEYLSNTYRALGGLQIDAFHPHAVRSDPTAVQALLAACPVANETPLVALPELAAALGIGALHIKDERARMGLGSFKALGAAFVIAQAASEAAGNTLDAQNCGSALAGQVFVAASAGNHGLSVAAGARVFGAKAVIYLAETVPAGFADRLRGFGADVVVEGADYAASMEAAQAAAADNGWTLLSDSTWEGYDVGVSVMEGYLAMTSELDTQMAAPPSHIFLQAGVGGLAGAAAAGARRNWGDGPKITVVEPDRAPALFNSIKAGKMVITDGPDSNMGRLDCKEPSWAALASLSRDADGFMLLSDEFVARAIERLEPYAMETSPSGGAGFAGLVAAAEAGEMPADARVLLILSEGPSGD